MSDKTNINYIKEMDIEFCNYNNIPKIEESMFMEEFSITAFVCNDIKKIVIWSKKSGSENDSLKVKEFPFNCSFSNILSEFGEEIE